MANKTYGIMFKDEMIRAYVQKQKTQTRRLRGLETVNRTPADWSFRRIVMDPHGQAVAEFKNLVSHECLTVRLPYGDRRNTLWFRETWRAWEDHDGTEYLLYRADNAKFQPFASDDNSWNLLAGRFDKWQPSMLMPRWASRFWNVPISGVRVERLHEITVTDALAEGVTGSNPRQAYFELWDQINGTTYPAQSNPWLFVYEFPVCDPRQVSKIHPHQEDL